MTKVSDHLPHSILKVIHTATNWNHRILNDIKNINVQAKVEYQIKLKDLQSLKTLTCSRKQFWSSKGASVDIV